MSVKFFVPPATVVEDFQSAPRDFLIGITGQKTHGKDTAYTGYRRNFWGFRFEQKMFATGIKKTVALYLQMLGYPPHKIRRHIFGDLKEAPIPELGGKSSRQLQQTLGTEWGRDLIDPDIWVKLTLNTYRSASYKGDRWMVTDVRFPNEVDAIKKLGGHVVRVFNPRSPVSTDTHPSEAFIPHLPVSAEIINDGRKIDLARDMARVVQHLTGVRPMGKW